MISGVCLKDNHYGSKEEASRSLHCIAITLKNALYVDHYIISVILKVSRFKPQNLLEAKKYGTT